MNIASWDKTKVVRHETIRGRICCCVEAGQKPAQYRRRPR